MNDATVVSRNFVGPIVLAGEIADALIAAIGVDNPGKTVSIMKRASYVRIGVDGGECVLHRATIQAHLGRPFQMRELEAMMPSFAGQIETGEDSIRWYFERSL